MPRPPLRGLRRALQPLLQASAARAEQQYLTPVTLPVTMDLAMAMSVRTQAALPALHGGDEAAGFSGRGASAQEQWLSRVSSHGFAASANHVLSLPTLAQRQQAEALRTARSLAALGQGRALDAGDVYVLAPCLSHAGAHLVPAEGVRGSMYDVMSLLPDVELPAQGRQDQQQQPVEQAAASLACADHAADVYSEPGPAPGALYAIGIKTWRRLKMKKHKIRKRRKANRHKTKK